MKRNAKSKGMGAAASRALDKLKGVKVQQQRPVDEQEQDQAWDNNTTTDVDQSKQDEVVLISNSTTTTRSRWNTELRRWAPVLVVALIALAIYWSGLTGYVSFESLKANRARLRGLVHRHSVLSPVLFVGLYTLLVAMSLPGATVLTLAAGFLFPQPLATILSVLGAGTGACIIFALACSSFGHSLRDRVANYWAGQRIERSLRQRGPIYLMLIRLIPIFPFWFVNIAPSVFGVRLWTFAWTTYLGILPGSYVYTQCGRGLAGVLDSESETLSSFLMKGLFNEKTAGPFALLAAWACFLLALNYCWEPAASTTLYGVKEGDDDDGDGDVKQQGDETKVAMKNVKMKVKNNKKNKKDRSRSKSSEDEEDSGSDDSSLQLKRRASKTR